MHINVIGKAIDQRTNTNVIYATMSTTDYLELVGADFSNFAIQRKKETHKAYSRLKKDILAGTLLPSITLAVKSNYVKDLNTIIDDDNDTKLAEELAKPGIVNILDGLQRTYILKDLENSPDFKGNQSLLLEFWLEDNIKHLIYRLIVLNSGQKPMSMRHQVELLFLTIKVDLEKNIPDLEIYLERDGSRRDKAGKFSLDRIVTAYQSFMTKSPEVKRDNIVASRLSESAILDSDEDVLDDTFKQFENHLKQYIELDKKVHKLYKNGQSNWLADENVMNAFFAALSDFGSISEARKNRTQTAIATLDSLLESATNEDPLALEKFNEIKSALNPKIDNVGYATRRLLFDGFKEYFREEGEKNLESCWISEAK